MATYIIASIIFIAFGTVVYFRFIKNNKNQCDGCCGCCAPENDCHK